MSTDTVDAIHPGQASEATTAALAVGRPVSAGRAEAGLPAMEDDGAASLAAINPRAANAGANLAASPVAGPAANPAASAGVNPGAAGPGEECDLTTARIPHVSIHVFHETDEFGHVWENAARDRRLVSATTEANRGSFAEAGRKYARERSPDLLIVETAADADAIGLQIDSLADVCDQRTRLIVVGHRNDILLYRRLVDMGVSSYLVAPVGVAALISAMSDIYRQPGSEKIGRVAAVIGAKGGVGASTVAQSLALDLSERRGSDVLLVDLDLAFGTASLNFDVEPNQGLRELIDQAERVDTAMLDRVVVRRGLHLSLLGAATSLDAGRDIDEFAIERILEVAQSHLRYTVLDVPHLWSGWVERALVAADDVVVVAMPELSSLRNAVTMLSRLKALRPNDPAPHLVLNQAGMPRRQEITARDVAAVLKVHPALSIPFDARAFSQAAMRGRMVAEVARRRPVVQAYAKLSGLIAPEETAPRRRPLLRRRWGRGA